MIVIGSYAAHLNGLTMRPRFKDLDLIGSEAEREQFRRENSDLIVKEGWVQNHRFRMDLKPGSEFDYVEFDTEETPSYRWLPTLCPRTVRILGSEISVPPLEVLYLIKRSHAHLPSSFAKAFADLKLLQPHVDLSSRTYGAFYDQTKLENDARFNDHRLRFGLTLMAEDITIPKARPVRYHRADLYRLVTGDPIYRKVRDLMRPGLAEPSRLADLTEEEALRLCREDFMVVGLERYATSDPGATSEEIYERGMIKAIRDLFQPELQAFAIDHATVLSTPPELDFVEAFRAAELEGTLRRVTLRPTEIKAEHRQIMALVRKDQLNEARCRAEDLARSADLSEDHHALYLLALVFLKLGKTRFAEACLRRCLWCAASHIPARIELGLVCLKSSRAKEAAHHLSRAQEAGARDLRTLQALARALEADKRPTEALAAYDAAITLYPDNSTLRERRAALVTQTA